MASHSRPFSLSHTLNGRVALVVVEPNISWDLCDFLLLFFTLLPHPLFLSSKSMPTLPLILLATLNDDDHDAH